MAKKFTGVVASDVRDKTVMVEAPEDVDHRALFMAWLGSNKFSSEYDEQEYQHFSGLFRC